MLESDCIQFQNSHNEDENHVFSCIFLGVPMLAATWSLLDSRGRLYAGTVGPVLCVGHGGRREGPALNLFGCHWEELEQLVEGNSRGIWWMDGLEKLDH